MYAQADYRNDHTGQQASITVQTHQRTYVVRLKRNRQIEEMDRVMSFQEANQIANDYQARLQDTYGMARCA